VREATARLTDRLDKAEKAVERERGDGERGRKALETLKKLEAELERRMCDQDEAFELKWAQRVAEANADRDAFRGKLARLEGEVEKVKISEERAQSELASAKRQIDELQLRLAQAPAVSASRADARADDARDAIRDDASKPRGRGFFSFITGVPEEPYAPKSARPVIDA
jgi:chromosome segregation ATPase